MEAVEHVLYVNARLILEVAEYYLQRLVILIEKRQKKIGVSLRLMLMNTGISLK